MDDKIRKEEIDLQCLLVNKPGHLVEFRPGEVQYFFYSLKNRSKQFYPSSIKKDWTLPLPSSAWQIRLCS